MPTPTDKAEYERVKALIKSRVSRFPSAYASGLIVQEYKRRMAQRGLAPYKEPKSKQPPLTRWFQEKWVDIQTGKPCGQSKSNGAYPTCRPTVRVSKSTPITVSEMTEAQKKQVVKAKQVAKKKVSKIRLVR